MRLEGASASQRSGAEPAVMAVAEALLLCVTLGAALSFSRLFSDNDWVGPVAIAAIAAHVIVAVCRRLDWGLLLTALTTGLGLVLQITWTHYLTTTAWGVPTATTRNAVGNDLRAAWDLFGGVKAPTPAEPGFVVLAAVAMWVVAYLADWAAFRLWSPVETLLPGFAVIVFVAFFGDETHRVLYTGIYLLAVVLFQLGHNLVRTGRHIRWLGAGARAGTISIAATGVGLSLLAVSAAVVTGPALPGAGDAPIVDVDQRSSGPDSRVVTSPLVDIRGRIVNQKDIVAFTVRTNEPSYWRLMSLDQFDGAKWVSANSYKQIGDTLPEDMPDGNPVSIIEQDFTILAMGQVWIPAAFEPRSVRSASTSHISYEASSGTLIVDKDLGTSDGLLYHVTSAAPQFQRAALENAPAALPADITERFLQLPDDFSPSATTLAAELTASQPTAYAKARALQDYFQQNFIYDLNVGPGHASDRIDEFLASERGYCEQFAGAYAAMARSVGLPARVAVGFTWGDQDPDDPTLYRVRGEHAHAWPEVYISGAGWVAFEPTPGRGAPNAEAWTGLAPDQESPDTDPAAATVSPEATPVTTPAPGSTDFPDPVFEEVPQAGGSSATSTDDGGLPGWIRVFLLMLVVAATAALLYAALVIWAKRLRRRRRLQRAADNRARVGAAWDGAAEALEPLGIRVAPSETIDEFAARAAQRAGQAQQPLRSLAALAGRATFSPATPSDDVVAQALDHEQAVIDAVDEQLDRRERLTVLLDPRPLIRR
jgi:transglutaminase-like putative cysteine protease